MFEGLYNKEQDAYHIQNSNDPDAICNFENGWVVVCNDDDRSLVEKDIDNYQNQRNNSFV